MRLLAWHLGLGDAVAFADIALHFARLEGQIAVPCWDRNLISVQSIFIQHPEVFVWPISNDEQLLRRCEDPKTIRVGHYSNIKRQPGEPMVDWIYRTVNMDPVGRFENNPVARACKIENQRSYMYNTTLLHEDVERGFVIDRERMPMHNVNEVVNSGGSILRLADWIEGAGMIHCIDSAVLHLVEQLKPRGTLHYHRYARPGSEQYHFRHNWHTLA